MDWLDPTATAKPPYSGNLGCIVLCVFFTSFSWKIGTGRYLLSQYKFFLFLSWLFPSNFYCVFLKIIIGVAEPPPLCLTNICGKSCWKHGAWCGQESGSALQSYANPKHCVQNRYWISGDFFFFQLFNLSLRGRYRYEKIFKLCNHPKLEPELSKCGWLRNTRHEPY